MKGETGEEEENRRKNKGKKSVREGRRNMTCKEGKNGKEEKECEAKLSEKYKQSKKGGIKEGVKVGMKLTIYHSSTQLSLLSSLS